MRNPELRPISVSMPAELAERMRLLKFNYGVSASAVVEQALLSFLADDSDQDLGERLRSLGAGRRRSPAA